MSNDEEGVTPGTLIDGARMYSACADAVNDKHPNALHVLSHMLGMSIELALKAFLRHRGRSVRDLRRLNHDLVRIFEECTQEGLTRTGSRNFVMHVLGDLYEKRAFAYPQEAVLSVIMPWRLRQMANELIGEIFPLIHPDALEGLGAEPPGLSILSEYPEDLTASAWALTPTMDGPSGDA